MKHILPVKIILVAMIIIVMTIIACGCAQDSDHIDDVITNEKIIQSKKFSVNSESTKLKTSVKGTVFLSGVGEVPDHAQIVALIEIDRDDWGGVVFYIPNKWHISSITSSYPEDEKEKMPEDYIAVWNPAGTDYEWSAMIEIGASHSHVPTGGGKGTVVIELDLDEENKNTAEFFSIMVGVGCDEKNGIKSSHPDHKIIEVAAP